MKAIHRSGNINQFGQISYLCFVDMQRRVNPAFVTFQDDYVTCQKCLKKIQRAKFQFWVRIFAYLEKQAQNSFHNKDESLLWWYMNGRDYFSDLHFVVPKN